MPRIKTIAAILGEYASRLPKLVLTALDWLVGVVERLVVLSIAFVTFYVGWFAFYGAKMVPKGAVKPPAVEFLTALSENWKGFLLLLIPLFYRTVRTFLERVEKFAGMETGPREKHTADSTSKGE
jgi:hypothetical protein